jgi:TonB family protein
MMGIDFFAQNAVKATVLLTVAFAATWMLRNRAAALRHFVWTAAFAALLLLPLATAVAPKWGWRTMPVAKTVVTVRQSTVSSPHAPVEPASRLPQLWPPMLWAAGFLLMAIRFSVGAIRTALMVSRAVRAKHAEEAGIETFTPLLESSEVPMPLAWGIRRPAVVLPIEAREWPPARLRTVLLHELTHVERRDLLAQAAGHAVCCLYWFHPLSWLAAGQLRKERERACDDAVLLRGIAAHDYAAHLVELVRAMAARRTRFAGAVGMAERSDLESRVRALLDRGRARQPLSRRAALAVGAATIAMLLPLAVLTTYAQGVRGGLAGVVKDPSGAVVPGCSVEARNLDGSNEETTVANPAGVYQFGAIPPGRYELQIKAQGFAILKVQATVSANIVARVDANLSIGKVSQAMTVVAEKQGSQPRIMNAAPPGTAERIRVGGMVQAARMIHMVRAVYPPDAQQEGIEGTVRMRAIISKTGGVFKSVVLNTDIDSRLAKAALDAVSQWSYQPALLNGEPVETVTDIDVEFKQHQ